MNRPLWRGTRFDREEEDPLGPLANFVDIIAPEGAVVTVDDADVNSFAAIGATVYAAASNDPPAPAVVIPCSFRNPHIATYQAPHVKN